MDEFTIDNKNNNLRMPLIWGSFQIEIQALSVK